MGEGEIGPAERPAAYVRHSGGRQQRGGVYNSLISMRAVFFFSAAAAEP